MPTTLGNYQIGHTLGSGVSCKVKLARDSKGTKYAIKLLHNDDAFADLIKAEVQTLKNLQHPNIVNLIEEGNGVMSNSRKGNKNVDYLVLELVNGGDLFDYVANSGRFSEDVARYYMTQLFDALDYMHKNGSAHRDLKPENIMLDSEFNLKVADFGFAAPIEGKDGSGFLHTQLGTQSYMAPEIHLAKPYTGAGVDLFATAIILFVMLSQRPPFNCANPQDPYYKLLAADRSDLFWKAHDDAEGGTSIYSQEFKDLFTQMTKLNPAQRPDMDQLKSHPWMQGPKPTKTQIIQEFRTRKQEVDAEVANERDEKRAQRAERKYDAHTSRGSGDELSAEQKAEYEEQFQLWTDIELEEYDEIQAKMTAFFTTAQALPVAFDLVKFLKQEWGVEAQMDGEAGKVKFVLTADKITQNDLIKVQIADKDPIKVTVKFSKVDDNKMCVEFNRRSGNQMVFLQKYKEIMASSAMSVFKDTSFV